LQHQLISDGRWRIICECLFRAKDCLTDACPSVFPGDIRKSSVQERLQAISNKLDGEAGVIRRYTPAGDDIDSVIQVLTVFATPRIDVEKQNLPQILKPKKSPYGVTG
jgi:phenol 2-monooxygenase